VVAELAPPFRGTPPTGHDRHSLPPRVVVISLAGNDGIEQIAEGARVLDRADPDVALQRPQRDLHSMASRASIPSRKTVTLLRPQLSRPVLEREILDMLHRILEARATVPPERRKSLVAVLRNQTPSIIALSDRTALTELVRDRAAAIRRALRRIDHARNHMTVSHGARLLRTLVVSSSVGNRAASKRT